MAGGAMMILLFDIMECLVHRNTACCVVSWREAQGDTAPPSLPAPTWTCQTVQSSLSFKFNTTMTVKDCQELPVTAAGSRDK